MLTSKDIVVVGGHLRDDAENEVLVSAGADVYVRTPGNPRGVQICTLAGLRAHPATEEFPPRLWEDWVRDYSGYTVRKRWLPARRFIELPQGSVVGWRQVIALARIGEELPVVHGA